MSSANYVGIIMAENLRFLGEGSSAQGKPGAKARPRGVVGRPGRKGPNISREVGDALWREKLCVLVRRPYRKPTQVDEERILRPTGEGLLRNSANCPRNFGIRGAGYGRPQRIGPSNCLPKTQVSAKSKDDV